MVLISPHIICPCEQLPDGSCRGLQAAVSCGLVTCVAEVLRGKVEEGPTTDADRAGGKGAQASDNSGEGEERMAAVAPGQKRVQIDASKCEAGLEDWASQEESHEGRPQEHSNDSGSGDGIYENDQDHSDAVSDSAALSTGVGSDLEDDLLM